MSSEVTVQFGMASITWETIGSDDKRDAEIDINLQKVVEAFKQVVPDIDVMNELPGEVFN